MKLWLAFILIVQTAAAAALVVAIQKNWLPLGVPGQWEWGRVKISPPPGWLILAVCFVVGYAVFATVGFRSLENRCTRGTESGWLAALAVAAVSMQVVIPTGAADEYDLTKWAYVNYFPGSTGYFKVAREQAIVDPWKFLARYPDWIQSQDSLHIGTHPPGLIAAQCIMIGMMDHNPSCARFLLHHMPASVEAGFRQLQSTDRQQFRRAEQAALYLTALVTLLACAGTVVPLYLLARVALPAPVAWSAAVLWPVVPAANLFQPVADTIYPFLSTFAWALASWSAAAWRRNEPSRVFGMVTACLSGVVMAFGLAFTLAFLPVGLVAGLIVITDANLTVRRRMNILTTIGIGCLSLILIGWLVTGANPLTVWSWNLHHHARFYDEYPRSYWQWLWVNPLEVAVAIGLPTTVWAVVAFAWPRSVPRSVWCLVGVLALVNLTGRNMGEVARLWLLFTPPLLIAAAYALNRCGGRWLSLAITAALGGFVTLALQSIVQVVYPL